MPRTFMLCAFSWVRLYGRLFDAELMVFERIVKQSFELAFHNLGRPRCLRPLETPICEMQSKCLWWSRLWV